MVFAQVGLKKRIRLSEKNKLHGLWERLLAAIIIISRLKAAPTRIFQGNLGFPHKRQKEYPKLKGRTSNIEC